MAEEISRVAAEKVSGPCHIDVAVDMLAARDRLMAEFYDLAVVHLTLPVRRGRSEPSLDTTNILLADIFDTGELRVPADLLGISLEPDVLTLVRNSVGQHLMGCLHADVGGLWKEDLAAKLRYVQASRQARQLVANSTHDIDVVVVTALDEEMRPYQDLFALTPWAGFPRSWEFSFMDVAGTMRRGLVHSVGRSGQAPTASATQALLCHFRPRLMIMTGFCGGVAERTSFGDVIIFKSSAAWDYGKWEDPVVQGNSPEFHPRPGALNMLIGSVADAIRDMEADYLPDRSLLGAVSLASGGRLSTWKLRPASAGSGSTVVTSSDKLSEITGRDDDIRAVDMESWAFYHACLNTPVAKPDFVCIKSVADFCDGQKDDSLHEACSLIAAATAKEIVTRRYDFGGRRS